MIEAPTWGGNERITASPRRMDPKASFPLASPTETRRVSVTSIFKELWDKSTSKSLWRLNLDVPPLLLKLEPDCAETEDGDCAGNGGRNSRRESKEPINRM